MEISIEYCVTCNYRPIAASLAFVIEKLTGVKPLLVQSNAMGALEVKADSRLIYSKIQAGRFPAASEVVELLKEQK